MNTAIVNASDTVIPILMTIIDDDALHAKWLNTLSMMENTGARKIMQAEHPREVPEHMLQHAAEEARHAYLLKKQIHKLDAPPCPTYHPQFLIGGYRSIHYLHKLDTQILNVLKR